MDSITLNVPDAYFPHDPRLPADFNYGSLLRNDPVVNQVFAEHVKCEKKRHVVIKNHLMPMVIEKAMVSPEYSDETRGLLKHIWENSAKLYIYRNVRDVLVSFYHHVHPKRDQDFSSFLHAESPYKYDELPDDYEGYRSKPRFWQVHVDDWMALVPEPVTPVDYQDLSSNFESTFRRIMQESGIPVKDELRKPRKQTQAERGFFGKLMWKLYRKGYRVRVESTAIEHSRRKGPWQDYFSSEDDQFTLAEAGDAMVRLGYHTQHDNPEGNGREPDRLVTC